MSLRETHSQQRGSNISILPDTCKDEYPLTSEYCNFLKSKWALKIICQLKCIQELALQCSFFLRMFV